MSVERIQSAIERRGQSLLLRRVTGLPQVPVDVKVKGMVRGYHAQELIGGIIQGDREVIISNKEIADILKIRESTVKFHLSNIFSKSRATSRKDFFDERDSSAYWSNPLLHAE